MINKGQLVFGESFGAVKEGRSHYWVSILLNSLYSASLFAFRKRIPAIGVLIAVIPYISKSARELLESNKQHSALTLEKVRKRIEMGDTNTDDIFAHILKNGGMNEPEMASEAMVLITGGAETTAVVLIAAGTLFSFDIAPFICRREAHFILGLAIKPRPRYMIRKNANWHN